MDHSHYVAFLDPGLLGLACAVSHEAYIFRSERCRLIGLFFRSLISSHHGVQRIIFIRDAPSGTMVIERPDTLNATSSPRRNPAFRRTASGTTIGTSVRVLVI